MQSSAMSLQTFRKVAQGKVDFTQFRLDVEVDFAQFRLDVWKI